MTEEDAGYNVTSVSFSRLIARDSALLEADFTTEGMHHDPGGSLAGSTKEGTRSIERGVEMLLGLKREVVLHLALQRLGAELGGCGGRDKGVDVARTGGEFVVAAGAEIAAVGDLTAGGAHLDQLAGDGIETDVTADRVNLDVAGVNIVEVDGALDGLDDQMAAVHVPGFDLGGRAFECYLTLEAIRGNGSTGRTKVHRGIGRHGDFVIDASALHVVAGMQTGSDFDAIAVLDGLHASLVGFGGRGDQNQVGAAGLDRDGAILGFDGDIGLGANSEAVFFLALGDRD